MLKVIGGVPDGEYKAIASGSLPNGKPVVVNADGTVSVIAETSGTETLSSDTQFPTTSNGAALGIGVAYDSANGKVIVSYRDASNSYYGTAVVGTVSGSSVTWGTPVVYNSTSMSNYTAAAYDTVNEKVVIAYRDANTYGYAIVGTVSGNSISFGTATAFVSTDGANYIDIAYDVSAGAMVINFNHQNSNGGKVIAGTVSGTSISFGTAVQFSSGTGIYGRSVYHPVENCTIIAWRDNTPSIGGAARALTVSGTTITLGTKVEYQSGGQANQNDIAYDSDSQKIVIICRDEVNVAYGSSYVGTVSGTTLTFASPVTFQSGAVDWMTIQGWYTGGVVAVYDYDVSSTQLLKYGTISGTTITWSSALTVSSSGKMSDPIGIAMDSGNSKMVLVYNPSGSASSAKYRVYNPDYTATNLTAENYIGMSRGVVEQTTVAQAAGTPVTFESALSRYTGAAYDANAQKIVIAYRDNGNSNYGTAVVGTVNASNNSISFGTPVVFEAAETAYTTITYDANAQKVVIAYEDQGNSQYGTAVVGTVSGTSISFGTPVVFNSGAVDVMSSTYDANAQKVVISYYDQSQNYGEAVVGTVSGTSISFGTPVAYKTNAIGSNSITYDSTNQKVVIVFRNSGGDLSGKAVVGTVSGTSISFGSEVTFSTQSPEYLSVSYDSNNQKIVIAYTASSNSSYGTAIVGTVSGTGISFGSASVFNTSTTAYNSIGYDANAQRVVISYRDSGNSLYGTAVAGEVSGSSITFNTPTVFQTGRTQEIGTAYDTNAQKIVLSYWDYAASTGDAVVFQAGYTSTDRSPVADGDPARVDIIGSVSDNQLSLTAGEKYYVQTDGTISTTAGDPSVLAGTAISATKLVVKT